MPTVLGNILATQFALPFWSKLVVDDFDSIDLFVLKHLWKLTPIADRQEFVAEISEDEIAPQDEKHAKAKRIWKRLSPRERESWQKWVSEHQ